MGRDAEDAAEVTRDDMEIVSAVRIALAGKVGQDRFELWFGAGTRLGYDGSVLRIGAPSRFFLEWIRGNFRRHIEGACCEVLGKCPAVEFHLDSTATEGDSESVQAVSGNGTAKPAQPGPRVAAAEHRADHAPPDPSAPLPRRRFASLDTFVASEPNRLAVASAEMIVRQPGQITPLMFHGPTSVGKTHLLEGIWTAARKSQHRLSVVYLSAEQFTSYFLEALRGSGLPNFLRKYRGVGLLMIDDLQFLVGKRATQVELLHTVDTFLRDGRQLVFAADRSPAELPELGPELTTRLTGGLVCRLEPPDYATRLGIIGQMARRMKFQVPPEVQEFIATRLTNHPRELSGALCRLHATSHSLGRPISLAIAEEALAEMIRHNGRVVRLPDIEKAVCEVFGLEPASLQSDAKGKRVSHPRMLAMWLARRHTRAALSEIGHYFGRRSHSTVISAQKRVDGWMVSGHPLALAEQSWPVDDAIRQVERRLAAG
jgi:chromosomal replication initiator protein